MHGDVEPLQQLLSGRRELLGQRRQDARRRLEQCQMDVTHGIEVLEAITGMCAGRLPDLGREFDARGTGADDDDVDMGRGARRRPRIGAHAGRQQSTMEALGVEPHVKRDCMLGHSRHAEVVADAADADHQRVVAQRAAR